MNSISDHNSLRSSTEGEAYADYLATEKRNSAHKVLSRAIAKRSVAGYRSPVLEIGCGTGRLLEIHRGTGLDHNVRAVEICRARGLRAEVSQEFEDLRGQLFETLLLGHVIEHMCFDEAVALVRRYLSHLAPGGLVILIVPQAKGFASDPTHETFFDDRLIRDLGQLLGLRCIRRTSLPLPAFFGRFFTHNQWIHHLERM